MQNSFSLLVSVILLSFTGSAQNASGLKNAHGCVDSAGYIWSILKKDCILPYTLEAQLLASDGSPAYTFIILSEDEKKVEVFMPGIAPFVMKRCKRNIYTGNGYQLSTSSITHSRYKPSSYTDGYELSKGSTVLYSRDPLAGSGKDEHGCSGSRGRVWSKLLAECVRLWDPELHVISLYSVADPNYSEYKLLFSKDKEQVEVFVESTSFVLNRKKKGIYRRGKYSLSMEGCTILYKNKIAIWSNMLQS